MEIVQDFLILKGEEIHPVQDGITIGGKAVTLCSAGGGKTDLAVVQARGNPAQTHAECASNAIQKWVKESYLY